MSRFIYCVRKPESNSSILTFFQFSTLVGPPPFIALNYRCSIFLLQILVVVPVTLAAPPPQSPPQPRWLHLVQPHQWGGGGLLNAVDSCPRLFPRVTLNGFTRPFLIDQNAPRDISFDFSAVCPNSTNIHGLTLFPSLFPFVSFPQFPPMWSTGRGTGLRSEESSLVCHSLFLTAEDR